MVTKRCAATDDELAGGDPRLVNGEQPGLEGYEDLALELSERDGLFVREHQDLRCEHGQRFDPDVRVGLARGDSGNEPAQCIEVSMGKNVDSRPGGNRLHLLSENIPSTPGKEGLRLGSQLRAGRCRVALPPSLPDDTHVVLLLTGPVSDVPHFSMSVSAPTFPGQRFFDLG